MKRLAFVVALGTALTVLAPQLASAQRVGGNFLRGEISTGGAVARHAFAPGRLVAHGLDFGAVNPYTGWGTTNLERYYSWQNGQVANFYANTGWGAAQPITGTLPTAYGQPAMVPIPGYVNGISAFSAVIPPAARSCPRVVPRSCRRVIRHACPRVIRKSTCERACPGS